MADLDAFVTIASNNGDTFNISSNNDLLIFTDNIQQNILIGTEKTYFPHILMSSSTVEVYKNITVQGDINLTGTLTQSGSTLGSKWAALWNTVYLLESNVSIGTTKSNSLFNIHDSNTVSPSNACITFTNDVVQDGFAKVGLSNTGDFIVWYTSNYNMRFATNDIERLTISSNGCIGVSNSTPSYALDVAGDINFTGNFLKNGTTFAGGQWSNNNDALFITESNVAIGRETANTLLHLHNPIADNSLITFTNSVTQSNLGVLSGLDSNGDGVFMHQNNHNIRIGTNNNEWMRVTADGKVGISTSFPAHQLDVYGSLGTIEGNVSSNLNTSNIYISGSFSSSNVANFNSNVNFNNLTFMNANVEMSSNLIVIQSITCCNTLKAEGGLTIKGQATLSNQNTLYDISYIHSNLIFVNAGSAYIASKSGNIGVQTENPQYTLDVNGSINATGYCNLLVDSYLDISVNKAPTANALFQLYSIVSTGTGDATFASNAAVPTSNLVYNTWNGYTTTSLYTTKSNVGIGTSLPIANLHISDVTDSNTFIQITNNNYSGKIGMSNDLLVVNNNFIKPIIFGNNGSEYIRITENGYLGVNKTNVSYPLDVQGDVNFTGSLYKNAVLYPRSRWESNVNGIYIQSNIGVLTVPSTTHAVDINGSINCANGIYDNGSLVISSRWTSNATGIYIQSNVGIQKIPSSTYAFDVSGDINFSGGLYQNGGLFQTSRWTSNADGIYVQSNIGLGKVPSTTYKLDVNGDVNFSGGLYQNGSLFQTSRWTSNADGIYVQSNIGVNKVPSTTYELDVNGDVNFSGGLYQNGSLFQTSRWSSNADGVFVQSNVGIKTNANSTDALTVNGRSTFAGDILPTNNAAYDLGSSTNRFRDLWLSSNSLRLGDVSLSSGTSNGIGYLNIPAGLKISSNIEIANTVSIRGLKILRRNGTMANITTTSIQGLSNDTTGIVLMMPSNAATDSMRFVAYGNELMRLTGTGNLGVGTTSPATKLQVQGTATINGDINLTGDIYKNSVLYGGSVSGYSNMVYTSSNIIQTSLTYSTSNDSFKWIAGSSSNELMTLTGRGDLTLTGDTNNFVLTDYGVSNLLMSSFTTGSIIVDSNSPFEQRLNDGSFGFDGTSSNNICFSNSIYSFNWWQNGGFTIEAWVNYSTFTNAALGGNYPALVGCMQAFTNPDYWSFGANTSGTLTFQYFTNTGNWVYATTTMTTNTWYHIALTYDMTNIRIFENGTLVSTPVALAGTPSVAAPFTIGNVGNAYPSVKISNLRYVRGAALYTANFTPPTAPLGVASSGTTMLLLKCPQEPSRMLPTKIGGTISENAYPPGALTSLSTTLSNTSYGVGLYLVNASASNTIAYNAFDNNTATEWATSVAYSTTSPFAYTQSTSTIDVNGTAYAGEFIQILLPNSITLSSYSIRGATNTAQSPGQWRVFGSHNSIDWQLINHQANIVWASSTNLTFNVVRSNPYNYYRFVFARTSGNGTGVCALKEIKLYGQQESVYVNTDGQIGIGKRTPSQALDVVGNVNVSGNISAGNMDMFRNRIINGDMRFDQRNGGVAVTVNSGTPTFSVDRWFFDTFTTANWTSGAVSLQQQTDAPAGFTNSVRCLVTTPVTATARVMNIFQQRIEGFYITDLGWGKENASPITLSFWTKTNVPGVHLAGLANNDGTATYTTTFTVQSANVWEYKKVTINPPPISSVWNHTNNIGVIVRIYVQEFGTSTYRISAIDTWQTSISYGTIPTSTSYVNNILTTTNNYVQITGVQFEKGNIATPFEFRPWSIEFQLCQRYFRYAGAGGHGRFYNASQFEVSSQLVPDMSKAPIITAIPGTVSAYASAISENFTFTINTIYVQTRSRRNGIVVNILISNPSPSSPVPVAGGAIFLYDDIFIANAEMV